MLVSARHQVAQGRIRRSATWQVLGRCAPRKLVAGAAEEVFPLGDGDRIALPKKKKKEPMSPQLDITKENAIVLQLQALQNNNQPYYDHGIEVLYRFADMDPFQRSGYFGRSFDLGQFERFRRIMHTPYFITLLEHERVEFLSSLQINERVWKQRIMVTGNTAKEQRVYEVTMKQRLGGYYDGYWFTESWTCDDIDWSTLRL